MPKLTSVADGAKMAKASGFNSTLPASSAVNGWSKASARRNSDFLMSVDGKALDGVGISFTLTVRDLPESHKEWERLRAAFVHRLRRMGMVRLHWLTEFQKRGAPHLHGIVFLDSDVPPSNLAAGVICHWLDLTHHLGTAHRAQSAKPVTHLTGWKKYLSKHGARSVSHYQRSSKPKGWEKTGRMWGKSGDWPTRITEFWVSDEVFFRVRRWTRSLLLSEARSDLRRARATRDPRKRSAAVSGALSRVRYLRGRLKCNDRQRSELRGMNDFLNPELLLRLLDSLPPDQVCPWEDRQDDRPTWRKSETVDPETGEILESYVRA